MPLFLLHSSLLKYVILRKNAGNQAPELRWDTAEVTGRRASCRVSTVCQYSDVPIISILCVCTTHVYLGLNYSVIYIVLYFRPRYIPKFYSKSFLLLCYDVSGNLRYYHIKKKERTKKFFKFSILKINGKINNYIITF